MKTIGITNWWDIFLAWPVMVYRLLRFGYTYRRIYLGEGHWTILEQADYYRLRKYRWIVYGGGNNLYAVRLKIVKPNRTWQISMHREIMNAPKGVLVDHRNCDSLDNRRSNLRFATRTENIRNRRKMKNSRSQYIGVYFSKQKGKWETRIMYQRKRIYLGRYDCQIDAAHAYDKAAKKYFGEFARLNFPEQNENSRALFAIIGKLMRQRSAGSV